jgi:hypothetical protein
MCKFIGPNPFSCYFSIIFHPKYIMYTPFDYANVLILTLQKWLLYRYYKLKLMGEMEVVGKILN